MFTPEKDQAQKVPFFEDAKKEDGWQGHTTTKSVDRLKKEITESVGRLGGYISGFVKGKFIFDKQEREGFQVFYSVNGIPSRIDIAALPVRNKWDTKKKEQSLRMALFMLRDGFDGMWLMQQLIPGYAPLVPFMIAMDGKTVSQLWAEGTPMGNLLPSGSQEFEVIDAQEIK